MLLFYPFDIGLFRQFESAILINLLIEIGRAHTKGDLSVDFYVYRSRIAHFYLSFDLYSRHFMPMFSVSFGMQNMRKKVSALIDFIFDIPM